MKKIIILAISIVITFGIITYIQFGKVKQVATQNKVTPITVLYERIGEDKGIYLYDAATKLNKKIYELSTEHYYVDFNIGVFFRKNLDESGIYVEKLLSGEEKKLLVKDYEISSTPRVIEENIMFLGTNTKDERDVKIISINKNSLEVTLREFSSSGNIDMDYVDFINKNTIVYSKMNNNQLYEIYKYDIEEKKEESFISYENSHAINPVCSRNGEMVAFLKRDSGVYNLYVLNINKDEKVKINLSDAVIGGSIKFSDNSKYIMCSTLNHGYKNKIKVYNFESGKISEINDTYNSEFSLGSEYLGSAKYNREKEFQEIYVCNIANKEENKVFSFYESGSYSKSIKIKMIMNNK